jgi:hypothetical protein
VADDEGKFIVDRPSRQTSIRMNRSGRSTDW